MSGGERLHAVVAGRVQGVGFRYWTVRQAQRLELTGWVRNLPDGRVEVVAEGPRAELEMLLDALRDGPGHSLVSSVTPEWLAASGEFGGFAVRG